MQHADYLVQKTGKAFADLFLGANPLVRLEDHGDGVVKITYWDTSLGPQPTEAELADAQAAPPSSAVLAPIIKTECSRRILAVASANTQMNMTTFLNTSNVNAADKASFNAFVEWVHDMRDACALLIIDADVDYTQDKKWPACPSEVVTFAKRF